MAVHLPFASSVAPAARIEEVEDEPLRFPGRTQNDLKTAAAGSESAEKDSAEQKDVDWEFLWGEYAKQMAAEKAWQDGGIDIQPEAVFVVKCHLRSRVDFNLLSHIYQNREKPKSDPRTKATNDSSAQPDYLFGEHGWGPKVFLNFCTNGAIEKAQQQPAPKGSPMDEPQLRIPLSISPPRIEQDTERRRCLAFDVVFHPDSVASARSDPASLSLLLTLVFNGLELKYGENAIKIYREMDDGIDEASGGVDLSALKASANPPMDEAAMRRKHGVKLMQKLKYKGTLPPPTHHIRKPNTNANGVANPTESAEKPAIKIGNSPAPAVSAASKVEVLSDSPAAEPQTAAKTEKLAEKKETQTRRKPKEEFRVTFYRVDATEPFVSSRALYQATASNAARAVDAAVVNTLSEDAIVIVAIERRSSHALSADTTLSLHLSSGDIAVFAESRSANSAVPVFRCELPFAVDHLSDRIRVAHSKRDNRFVVQLIRKPSVAVSDLLFRSRFVTDQTFSYR